MYSLDQLKKIFIEKGKLGSLTQTINSIIQWANISGKPTTFPPDTHEHEGTEILSTGEAGGTKFLRENGDGTSSWQAVGGGLLNKLDATTAPTVNDDSGDGYEVGSIWIDVTNDLIYQATDATIGAAVWKCLSSVINDDAPSDGTIYGRKDGIWAMISIGSLSFLSLSISDDAQLTISLSSPSITWT